MDWRLARYPESLAPRRHWDNGGPLVRSLLARYRRSGSPSRCIAHSRRESDVDDIFRQLHQDHAPSPRRGKGSETLGRFRETRRDVFQLTAGQMQLAKNVIDFGLSTNNLEPMLRFWQQDAGLRFDHVLPVRRGQKQYRHDALGSVIKLNHHVEPLPAAAPSGYRELIIARAGVTTPRTMVDPDGNRVRLVPPGHDGVTQLGQRFHDLNHIRLPRRACMTKCG